MARTDNFRDSQVQCNVFRVCDIFTSVAESNLVMRNAGAAPQMARPRGRAGDFLVCMAIKLRLLLTLIRRLMFVASKERSPETIVAEQARRNTFSNVVSEQLIGNSYQGQVVPVPETRTAAAPTD